MVVKEVIGKKYLWLADRNNGVIEWVNGLKGYIKNIILLYLSQVLLWSKRLPLVYTSDLHDYSIEEWGNIGLEIKSCWQSNITVLAYEKRWWMKLIFSLWGMAYINWWIKSTRGNILTKYYGIPELYISGIDHLVDFSFIETLNRGRLAIC